MLKNWKPNKRKWEGRMSNENVTKNDINDYKNSPYPQGVCPHCGYCPTCGRRLNDNIYPYPQPWYPWYPQPYYQVTCQNGGQNDAKN